MTITYSLDVANTRFCGFTKLLGRWKGSIYKILWKELLCFSLAYAALSVSYRCFLTDFQKRRFEEVVIYCETFIELIPLSFVLGFYVSLVIGRWWNQFDAIPWPDRTCLLIATVVHGSDERSRTIRRTLGRYLILLQMFTFQSVSTAFKKRFPTVQHFQEAGLMTKEELTIYEQVDIPYGKWWLPAHWFCALATRAKKEGRIKDSVLLKLLLKELLKYRSTCGTMFNYDWISVPLVYTQVVTLATYSYCISLLMGRQYLDPERGFKNHEVDLYVPFFTLLQFFFYVGWLKVAEQIVNPYGEDDDDFELNWCLDRNSQIVYMLVDHLHTKHPKLRRDMFWDQLAPQIPHTKFTVKNVLNPQLGSTANFEVDPRQTDFLPMDTLLEEDSDTNVVYDSIKRSGGGGVRYRPSLLMNLFNAAGFGQSVRRKSTRKDESFRNTSSSLRGHVNPAFAIDGFAPRKGSTPSQSRRSSKKSPSVSRTSSISFRKGSTVSRNRNKTTHEVHQEETMNHQSTNLPDIELRSVITPTMPTPSQDEVSNTVDESNYERQGNQDKEQVVQKPAEAGVPLPSIPEEPSRPNSMYVIDADVTEPTCTNTEVQDLVAEASKVIEELNKAVQRQGHRKECELLGYESCCSLSSDDDDEEVEEMESTQHFPNPEIPDDISINVDHLGDFYRVLPENTTSEKL